MANPQRRLKSENLPSEASVRLRSTDDPFATSKTTQAADQSQHSRNEDEVIVQTATSAGDWIGTAVVGLGFLTIIGVTAHFVGLIPTIAGALVIVGALFWLVSSALGDATTPWKFRD